MSADAGRERDWDPRSVVERKRDGHPIDAATLRRFILGFARGEIPDYLAAAFLMAAFIRGMDHDETVAMLDAMIDSGERLSFPSVDRPIVDKHSTGGVADGVTLVFAPLAAALGLAVAKLSGRGLGHTGGTLDKLEAIPGLRTDLEPDRLERQVAEIGCAIGAQSPEIVPADGALYALRDATATVPRVPFIATSVMSKKLAVGSDLILLDVKAGSGAFMKDVASATELAETCVALAREHGRPVRAAVTDMSQPLGDAVGNALDVMEAVEVLRGERRGRLREAVEAFAAEALVRLGGEEPAAARSRVVEALDSGAALQRFARLVEAQGGDPRVVDDPIGVLPRAPVVVPLVADREGAVASMEAEEIGRASSALGAGRRRKGEAVDPSVGLVLRAKIGDRLGVGQEIGTIHARDPEAAAEAARRVLAAIRMVPDGVEVPPLFHAWIGD